MVHSFFNTIVTSSSPAIARDKDIFFNCSISIETLSVAFPVLMLSPAKAIDKFSAILSASAKSFPWRNIYCSNS